MGRQHDGDASTAIDARALSAAQAEGAIFTDFDKWGGQLTSCVGAHMLYGPFSVAAGASVVLDGSMDWRDRMLMIMATGYKTTDIRPGTVDSAIKIVPVILTGGTDLLKIASDFYTGGGWDGNPATPRGGLARVAYCPWIQQDNTVFPDLPIYADSTNGNRLTIKNFSASTYSGSIMIFATEPTGKVVAVP